MLGAAIVSLRVRGCLQRLTNTSVSFCLAGHGQALLDLFHAARVFWNLFT